MRRCYDDRLRPKRLLCHTCPCPTGHAGPPPSAPPAAPGPSTGEVRFVLVGVAAQAASIAAEAARLCLVQVLLQGTDIKLTPLSTM